MLEVDLPLRQTLAARRFDIILVQNVQHRAARKAHQRRDQGDAKAEPRQHHIFESVPKGIDARRHAAARREPL